MISIPYLAPDEQPPANSILIDYETRMRVRMLNNGADEYTIESYILHLTNTRTLARTCEERGFYEYYSPTDSHSVLDCRRLPYCRLM